jgi:CheY-like chemotaxis protein
MPVMDGFEATRRIHGREETRGVPVVACTAFTDRRSREKALVAGCADYVTKPVSFEVLDGLLRRHLHIH